MSISVKSSSKPISRVFSQGCIQVLTMCLMFFFAGENPTFVGGIFIFVAERLKPWLTHDCSSNSSISPCHGTMACQSSRAGMAVLAVTWKMSDKSIPGGPSHSVRGSHFFVSMDWLKGKSTGNPCFLPSNIKYRAFLKIFPSSNSMIMVITCYNRFMGDPTNRIPAIPLKGNLRLGDLDPWGIWVNSTPNQRIKGWYHINNIKILWKHIQRRYQSRIWGMILV